MIARISAALIAGALILPAAPAQTPTAAPDPAALDLARLLMSRDPSLYDDADLTRFRVRIETALLGAAGSCNPSASECQAAAREVAAQYAPTLRQAQRETSERFTAATLAGLLRPEEISHLAALLRSEEGRHFFDAWAALRDPERARQRRDLQRDLASTAPIIFAPAQASFRQRTRNLPRPAPR